MIQQILSVTIVEAVIMQLVFPPIRKVVFAQAISNGLNHHIVDAHQQLQPLFKLTKDMIVKPALVNSTQSL